MLAIGSWMLPAALLVGLAQSLHNTRTQKYTPHSTAPAVESLSLQVYSSARRTGISQHSLGHHLGITPLLGLYLQQANVVQIQQEAHVIDFSAGAPGYRTIVEDLKAG